MQIEQLHPINALQKELVFELPDGDNRSELISQQLSLSNTGNIPLFYKILSNAHDRYVLNKTKGTIVPGETIQVEVSVYQKKAIEAETSKDIFKIQYFKELEDGPIGCIFISSYVTRKYGKSRSISRRSNINGPTKIRKSETLNIYSSRQMNGSRNETLASVSARSSKRNSDISFKSTAPDRPAKCPRTARERSPMVYLLIALFLFMISFEWLLPFLVNKNVRHILEGCADSEQVLLVSTSKVLLSVHDYFDIARISSDSYSTERLVGLKEVGIQFLSSFHALLIWIFNTELHFVCVVTNLGWLGLTLSIVYLAL